MKKDKFNKPNHVSLTKDTFCYSGKMYDLYDYYEKKWIHRRVCYTYIRKFWEKHVGENYDECKKLLIRNLKKKFGYGKDNIKFLDCFIELESTKYPYTEFVIDENGNIFQNKRKPSSHNTLWIDGRRLIGYTFSREDFTTDELNIIIKRVGKDRLHRMFTETITSDEFKKLCTVLSGDWDCKGGVDISKKCHEVIEGELMEFGRRTPLYKRYKKEGDDAYNKKKRLRRKEKLRLEETLLHDVLMNRQGVM